MKRIMIWGFIFFIIFLNAYGSGKKEQGKGEEPVDQEISWEDVMEDHSSEMAENTNLAGWVEILGMGIEIGTYTHLNKKVTVEGVWEFIHGIGWDSVPDKKGYIIHFYQAGGQPLVSYMLVPHQNLFKKSNPLSNEIIPPDSFYTSTEHAMVFGPLFRKNSEYDEDLLRRIEEIISYTTSLEFHNTIISEKAEAPIPYSLQVISLKMYPYYMVMDVALPGSVATEDKELLALSGNRMIRLSLIPDTGQVIQRWIAPPGNTEPFNEEQELKKVIYTELKAFLEETRMQSVDPVSDKSRLNVFITIKEKGEKCLKNPKNEKRYLNLILRLLALDQSFGYSHGFDPGEMFPDYEPKITPDEILDYRPALGEIFDQLPGALLDNLTSLISLHDDYKNKAKSNPGTLIDGNVILGAPEKEYIPSDEELILCEIDKRINIIVSGIELKTLQKYDKEHGLAGIEFSIMTVEIWHVDVMGSGRFFYASQPETGILLHLE